jgi:glutamate dehydrogenase
VESALLRYFPRELRERYSGYMSRHPLKREIIATHVTNSMLNRVGSTFVHYLMEITGFSPAEIVRAYLLTREVFGLVPLWKEIEALDNKVEDRVQAEMVIEIDRLVVRATAWFLRSRRLNEDMASVILYFSQGVDALARELLGALDDGDRERMQTLAAKLRESGAPESTALRVASLDALFAALDIIEVAANSDQKVERVAGVYFDLATRLGLPELRKQISALPADQHWQAMARNAMFDDLAGLQSAITRESINGSGENASSGESVDAWESRNRRAIERMQQLLAELRNAPAMDVSMISVALRELRHLA